MRLLTLSDLHLEMHRDGGKEFLEGLPPAEGTVETLGEDGVDAVALVGDICAFSQLPDVLQWFCDNYGDVFYVWGNHECYGHTISAVRELALALQDKFSNLHVLDNNRWESPTGTSFIGATLWYRDAPDNFRLIHQLNDFHKIDNLLDEVYKENEKTIDFLREETRERDVVLTHYMPSSMSVAERFEGDPFNCFFLCDMEDVIKEKQPKLWLHGHTHDSFDYTIFRTQVVCNPFGYPHELNPAYHPLILDV